MNSKQQVQWSINEKISSQIPSYVHDCTVPIVIAHEGTVHQFGTGTLFRVGDHHFLVTAAHVIESEGKTLGIGGSDDGRFIALTGNAIVSSEYQYGLENPFDIAIYHLPTESVMRLTKAQFMHLHDVDFGEQSPTAVYMLYGSPGEWSSPILSGNEILQLRALQYTAYRYNRDTSGLPNYTERFHLLLDAQFSEVTDGNGCLVTIQGDDRGFPNLGGISGCSVWQIGDLKTPLSDWGKGRVRIVGVQTSVFRRTGAIKATRWVAVSTLIHEAFPELRGVLQLWRPS